MRVLFVTQYGPLAASSRTRVFNYLPFLRTRGVECTVRTILPDELAAGARLIATRQPLRKTIYYLRAVMRTLFCGLWVAASSRRFDLLFVQKVIFPRPVRWWIRRQQTPVVYDFDDAIFTTEIRSGHWLARWKEARNARGLPAMLALASHAVVENDYTGEFARRYCPVLSITGPIELTPYADAIPTRTQDGTTVLGWIGSASTVAYLDRVRGVLQELTQRHRVRLLIIGAQWSADGVETECRPWDLAREAADLADCDIGIMPVPDDPWTRGKGGYKLLQYMAAGLPVVTDPVGINVDIVADGDSGLLASGNNAWVAALERLVTEPELCQRLGAEGRRRVEARYAQSVQQDHLLVMLQQVAGVPAA